MTVTTSERPAAAPGPFNILVTPVMLLICLSMVILPIPPLLLDFLFSFSIAFALTLLTVSINIHRPLEFSVFPTLLLMATLLRLGLNIASTRLVLLHGHEGTIAAGRVIEAFGQVVIAGNYVVGLLVFIILVIVNFVVITKGGSRISEVSARFTLDAMPGKQMAIDADLNSGVIDHEQAKLRREEVTREADFYGAMDGASKFVRGDAIAGLLILLINIIGGLLIGTLQQDMDLTTALRTYALLTIGDGLVTQIPSLLMSTTAAIMVTRVSGAKDIHSQFRQEVLSHPRAILVAATVLIIIGLTPGMPHLAFIGPGLLLILLALQTRRTEQPDKSESTQTEDTQDLPALDWSTIPLVEPLGLDIGYRLISLMQPSEGGDLIDKIKNLRADMSRQFGFLIPAIHIRDNVELEPESYSILFHNIIYARFSLKTDSLLAFATDSTSPIFETPSFKEPSYGLNAWWINSSQRNEAISSGYTVVDCTTVIATHLGKMIEDNISELFGYEETEAWVENLRRESPKLCDELIPEKLSLAQLLPLLKSLLADAIALHDKRLIATTLLQHETLTGNHFELLQKLRIALRRQITSALLENQPQTNILSVFTLTPGLEKMLLMAREQARTETNFSEENIPLEPSLSLQLQQNMNELINHATEKQIAPVLLAGSALWPLISHYARAIPGKALTVLAYPEIPDQLQVEIIGQLG